MVSAAPQRPLPLEKLREGLQNWNWVQRRMDPAVSRAGQGTVLLPNCSDCQGQQFCNNGCESVPCANLSCSRFCSLNGACRLGSFMEIQSCAWRKHPNPPPHDMQRRPKVVLKRDIRGSARILSTAPGPYGYHGLEAQKPIPVLGKLDEGTSGTSTVTDDCGMTSVNIA